MAEANLRDSRQSGAQETSAQSLAFASCDCRQTIAAGVQLPVSNNQDVSSHIQFSAVSAPKGCVCLQCEFAPDQTGCKSLFALGIEL